MTINDGLGNFGFKLKPSPKMPEKKNLQGCESVLHELIEQEIKIDSLGAIIEKIDLRKTPDVQWVAFASMVPFNGLTVYHAYLLNENHEKLGVLTLDKRYEAAFKYNLVASVNKNDKKWYTDDIALLKSRLGIRDSSPKIKRI